MNQLIKQIALDAMEHSKPVKIFEATVSSSPPNIQIRLRSNPKLIIPKDLIIALDSSSDVKAGDTVMVASLQGGQAFLIMGKAKRW
ncbi:hypothetical protein J14TS2_15990 [Bacillus sp. J14TS2]|uniref:DUF2577 family protein n=1 Tax=Bacillus sp. J14TS2 TaxID=2807188 RepID=UPI001B27413E|nr:DUF2577 family protein [Bacillus sp. J14TS2]GIN71124.1 hypothetical protein J14TS2_15990 [Bacillus sp. J14TS2]